MLLVLAALGIVAGVLTTIAGQGGGLFLLVACSSLVGPHEALAVTAPALLFGNVHRAVGYRRSIDRAVALRTIAGAVPGALLGGLAAGATPAWALDLLLVSLTAAAVARGVGLVRFTVSREALAPAGLALGAMTGTAGGAGVLLAPLLLAAGLSGPSFVGTTSAVAAAMHAGRVVAYGASGILSPHLVGATALVAGSIFAGNVVGGRLRTRLSRRSEAALEYGVLVVAAARTVARALASAT